MTYTLNPLPYPFNTLEPHIDTTTIEIHHTRHHKTYLTNLNKTLKEANVQAPKCPCALISKIHELPPNIQTTIRNNAGGFVNHNLYFNHLSPNPTTQPQGPLAEAINRDFNNTHTLIEQLNQTAMTRFGSGWSWLISDPQGKLTIGSTANQDNPRMGKTIAGIEGKPILGIDIWEHAYYLKYQNKKNEYLDAFWKILNWEKVEATYQHILKCKCGS